MAYTVKTAQELLPKLGEHRWERPTIDENGGFVNSYIREPKRCVVVEVNPEHLWYTVQFENGIRESYKVPKAKTKSKRGLEL